MFSHTIPSMSSSDPQKIRKQTAANNLLSGKKTAEKQQLVWKSCWLSRKWANYHLSIRSCHNSTTNPLLDQMPTSRSSTLPRLDRVGVWMFVWGLSSLCVRFFVSENLVTAWIWAWNHSLTKWMVYHDGWLAAMFTILKMRKLIYRRQPFLTSGLYRWSSQRNLWCSSADWESGELFRWKLGQNSLEQFHSSWRYFIHPV